MSGSGIGSLFFIFIMVPLFFLPTIIAIKKRHKHKIPIILINIFGGFMFGIGWIIALVWCFIEPKNNMQNHISIGSEIEKLHALKVNGALTEEEFANQKKELLGS